MSGVSGGGRDYGPRYELRHPRCPERGGQQLLLAPKAPRRLPTQEAYWRQMKHQWLLLNTLDSVAAVRRHVSTYVAAHNGQIPHSAFRGQTPDEMYFGRGDHVPANLATASEAAREARLHANRAMTCDDCSCLEAASAGSGVEAA